MPERFFEPKRANKDKQDVTWNPSRLDGVLASCRSAEAPSGGSANPGSAVGYKHGGSGTPYAYEQQGFVGSVQEPAEP